MIGWLLQHAGETVALAVLVWLLCRLARRHPAVCHSLWLIVLVKLLLPPGVVLSWRLPASLQPGVLDAVAASRMPVPVSNPEGTVAEDRFFESGSHLQQDRSDAWEPEAVHQALQPDLHTPEAAAGAIHRALIQAGTQPFWPRVLEALVCFWIVGALVTAIVQICRIARFRRLIRGAGSASSALQEDVETMAARLHVRPPGVLVVKGSLSPVLWSFGRPRLIWPEGLSERLTHQGRLNVLVHELAHLKRRDHWAGWLILVAGCIWWWNPLFWYVKKRVLTWAEQACDAWVVWVYPRHCRDFAKTLIEVSRFVSDAVQPLPAMRMSTAAFHELERRLKMILNHRVRRRVPAWGLCLLGILGLAMLPGFSYGQEQKEKPAGKGNRIVSAEAGSCCVGQDEDEKKPVKPFFFGRNTKRRPPQRNGKRPFGPEQATGAPDTLGSGHIGTAWAAMAPECGEVWLMLTYRHAVHPGAVRIYETFNPGAVTRVSVLNDKGSEVVAWQGIDPTGVNRKRGISMIPLEAHGIKTRHIMIHLDTRRVKGWNEIDAVELLGEEGPQFAISARASSTCAVSFSMIKGKSNTVIGYGGGTTGGFLKARKGKNRILRAPQVDTFTTGRININPKVETFSRRSATRAFRSLPGKAGIRYEPPKQPVEKRLEALEREVKEMRVLIEKLHERLGRDI